MLLAHGYTPTSSAGTGGQKVHRGHISAAFSCLCDFLSHVSHPLAFYNRNLKTATQISLAQHFWFFQTVQGPSFINTYHLLNSVGSPAFLWIFSVLQRIRYIHTPKSRVKQWITVVLELYFAQYQEIKLRLFFFFSPIFEKCQNTKKDYMYLYMLGLIFCASAVTLHLIP